MTTQTTARLTNQEIRKFLLENDNNPVVDIIIDKIIEPCLRSMIANKKVYKEIPMCLIEAVLSQEITEEEMTHFKKNNLSMLRGKLDKYYERHCNLVKVKIGCDEISVEFV